MLVVAVTRGSYPVEVIDVAGMEVVGSRVTPWSVG